MARLRRLVIADKIFFVTTNLRRGMPPLTAKERDLLCEVLAQARGRRKFRLAGFVIMPDHMHLLLLPAPGRTISVLLQEVKYITGRTLNAARKTQGTVWQKGFFDRFMRTPREFSETLDYLHYNPVRKGLVALPEEWLWSSASAYRGLGCLIPVDFIELQAQSEKPLR